MLSGNKTRRNHQRDGATSIEFAFVVPFIFFLVFGSIEFSRMMMVRQAMTNAAREGCRHASLVSTRDYGSAEAFVRQRLQGVIADCDDPEVVRVTFSPDLAEVIQNGSRITAAIEVDCEHASWLPPFLFAGVKIRTYSLMSRELTGWEPEQATGTGEEALGANSGN